MATVCDVCYRPGKATRRYGISRGSRRVTADLCRQHSEPLETLLGAGEEESRGVGASSGRRSFDDAVVTMEDIEALKRQRHDDAGEQASQD